jgi:hypothetical protein
MLVPIICHRHVILNPLSFFLLTILAALAVQFLFIEFLGGVGG